MTDFLPDRRQFTLSALCAGLTAGVGLPSARAQERRPASGRIFCGFPPGGSVDLVSRKLAEKLSGRVAGSVLVDNRPGAAGRLAVQELLKATADGSTLLVTPASVLTLYPHVYRQLSYEPLTELAPVCSVANTAFALAVGPKVPATVASVDDLVRWCRAFPAEALCGNAGAGSLQHLLGLLLARELAIDLRHVPYRSGSAAMQAVASGEVSVALSTESAAQPHQQGGRLRILASTAPARSRVYPQVPTFRDLGFPALSWVEWFGVFVPAPTPADTVRSIADSLASALTEPDLVDAFERAGVSAEGSSTAALQAAIRREHAFWGPLVKSSGFTPES